MTLPRLQSIWRSIQSRRTYEVIAHTSIGVKVQELNAHFPRSRYAYLPEAMFQPPHMQLEEVAIQEDLDRLVARAANHENSKFTPARDIIPF
jgi:hypothetical protein